MAFFSQQDSYAFPAMPEDQSASDSDAWGSAYESWAHEESEALSAAG